MVEVVGEKSSFSPDEGEIFQDYVSRIKRVTLKKAKWLVHDLLQGYGYRLNPDSIQLIRVNEKEIRVGLHNLKILIENRDGVKIRVDDTIEMCEIA